MIYLKGLLKTTIKLLAVIQLIFISNIFCLGEIWIKQINNDTNQNITFKTNVWWAKTKEVLIPAKNTVTENDINGGMIIPYGQGAGYDESDEYISILADGQEFARIRTGGALNHWVYVYFTHYKEDNAQLDALMQHMKSWGYYLEKNSKWGLINGVEVLSGPLNKKITITINNLRPGGIHIGLK